MNYLSAVLREEEAQLAKKVLLEYEEKLRNVELIENSEKTDNFTFRKRLKEESEKHTHILTLDH